MSPIKSQRKKSNCLKDFFQILTCNSWLAILDLQFFIIITCNYWSAILDLQFLTCNSWFAILDLQFLICNSCSDLFEQLTFSQCLFLFFLKLLMPRLFRFYESECSETIKKQETFVPGNHLYLGTMCTWEPFVPGNHWYLGFFCV
jgi:hypothetical protein